MVELSSTRTILILGSAGMLGHKLFTVFSNHSCFNVTGTVRRKAGFVGKHLIDNIIENVQVDEIGVVEQLINSIKPDVVINCIGIIKQLPAANNYIQSIAINALFPHQLSEICHKAGSRMIHFSTDCVFSGNRGSYTEVDLPDPIDLYGYTKYLGEVNEPHCVTLRTSIIGHEVKTRNGLVEWFLAQKGSVQGYKNAIYTGFPTIEISRIICDFIIPNDSVRGLVHISSAPISKFDLLCLIASAYQKDIKIELQTSFRNDRSLISDEFRSVTGYQPPEWSELVRMMYEDYLDSV